jgi:hypothetical protein
MSENVLMDAVRKIQEDMDKLLLEVKKKKQAINVLHESMGEQPPYEIEGETKMTQVLRPDQFYGKSFATVAAEYLAMRKQACTAIEIMEGLKKGGFDFPHTWKADDRLRNVAISLSKNSQLFQRLPNATFGLLEWYPTKKRPTKAGELIKKLNEIEEGVDDPVKQTGNTSDKEENKL